MKVIENRKRKILLKKDENIFYLFKEEFYLLQKKIDHCSFKGDKGKGSEISFFDGRHL
jgi:hypothetical protein